MERIAEIRKERGWSQVKLGAAADVNPSTVNQIERGLRHPNSTTLEKLADALEVEIADLFGRAEAPKATAPSAKASPGPHEREVRTYKAAAHYGRNIVESFKNFRRLDLEHLKAFGELSAALATRKQDIWGNDPDDLAEAIDEYESAAIRVQEALNEHLDLSPESERREWQQELKKLQEFTAVGNV